MMLSKAYKAIDRLWAFAIENDERGGHFLADGTNFYIAYNAPKDMFEVYPAHIYPEPMMPSFSSEESAQNCIDAMSEMLKPIFI